MCTKVLAYSGVHYIGIIGLNVIKANDYMNVILQVKFSLDVCNYSCDGMEYASMMLVPSTKLATGNKLPKFLPTNYIQESDVNYYIVTQNK